MEFSSCQPWFKSSGEEEQGHSAMVIPVKFKVLIALNLCHCQSQACHPTQQNGINFLKELFLWLLNGPARQLNCFPLVQRDLWCEDGTRFLSTSAGPTVAGCPEVLSTPICKLQGRNRHSKEQESFMFLHDDSKNHKELQTEGQNIAAKSLLDC